jgi:hypothetical protein
LIVDAQIAARMMRGMNSRKDTSHMAGLGGRWNDAPTLSTTIAALSRMAPKQEEPKNWQLVGGVLVGESVLRRKGATDADIASGRFVARGDWGRQLTYVRVA